MNKLQIEKTFIEHMKNKLNKEYEDLSQLRDFVSKYIGEYFMNEIYHYYKDIVEFNVVAIIQNNILLIKIEKEDITLIDIIMSIDIKDKITIKDILITIKNM